MLSDFFFISFFSISGIRILGTISRITIHLDLTYWTVINGLHKKAKRQDEDEVPEEENFNLKYPASHTKKAF